MSHFLALILGASWTLISAAADVPPQYNMVFILTDDQDVEFGGLEPMRHTKKLLVEEGMEGNHFYVATPICCPSRAQILSGNYAHNLRDRTSEPFAPGARHCGDEPVEDPTVGRCGCMRMNCTSEAWEETNYANSLQRAGYRTAYFGKYLNPPAIARYCRNETLGPMEGGWPSGWDVFYGMCDQASTPEGGYYDMNWIDSTQRMIDFTGHEPGNYTTSIIGNKTVAFIQSQSQSARGADSEQTQGPFFVVAATRAPHMPYLPPVWYLNSLPDAAVDRSDVSYNATTTGKPGWLGRNPPLSEAEAAKFDKVGRLEDPSVVMSPVSRIQVQ
jgi:N-acetylglucosamine-6-sulfatase